MRRKVEFRDLVDGQKTKSSKEKRQKKEKDVFIWEREVHIRELYYHNELAVGKSYK